MSTSRQRTRRPLSEMIEQLRLHRPPLALDTGVLHALRQFGAACYELGASDVHGHTTLPAPHRAPDDDAMPAGPYSLVEPHRDDEL